MSQHDGDQLSSTLRESRESVQGPRAHEGLRERDILDENPFRVLHLLRAPRKQRQRANDLQPNLPLVALRERAEKDELVRLDSFAMLVREFLQQIESSLSYEPVVVTSEVGQNFDERRVPLDKRSHLR
jgi:hypothetical protein